MKTPGVLSIAVLLLLVASGVVVATTAVSVIVVRAGGSTTRVTVALAPGSRVEKSQVMNRLPEHVPRLVLIEIMPVPDRTVLLSVTCSAGISPALDTTIV